MPNLRFLVFLGAMALVTYLIRAVPLIFIKKEIKSRFVKSFLYYVPYSVLSAMTFPAVFESTGHVISAAVGTLVALVLSYFRKPLLPVAAASALAVFVTELLIPLVVK